jgi:DNA polymerase I-like protein with 3'-5' exonuclease and polymerase domains
MANKPMQLPMWKPESNWKPPRVGDLPSWEGAKRVGFDCETKDPFLKQLGPGCRREDSHMIGFSFAFEDGPSFYVPLRHAGGDNVEDPEQAINYLRDQAKHFPGILTGANMSYDLDWSATEGVRFPEVKFFRDVQIADPLINELHRSYSLQAIAERHGMPGKDTELLIDAARHYNVDPKGGMWQLPARYVGPYAGEDARLPLLLLRRQERVIDEQDLQEVFDLECRVLPVLLRMRRRGVRFSHERLSKIEDWSLDQEAEALAKIKHLTGVTIDVGDVWKSGVLAPALEAIGVKVPTTMGRGKTPSPSIDKELLASIDHPVADAIAWARKTNKLRTTFAQSIRKHSIGDRIHCSYNQLRQTSEFGNERGAAYGRLSSENPNMQQQPARDEFATMWRSIYLPEEGAQWGALDYSQQEPRMLIHYAELCKLPGAKAAAQQYRDDPATDNHQMMADMAGVQRKQAKELFLGKCYGMGGAKLCDKLGLPTGWLVVFGWKRDGRSKYFDKRKDAVAFAQEHGIPTEGLARIGEAGIWRAAAVEGQAIIDRFDEKLPFVKKLARKCQDTAKARGFIRTLSGRRCRFPTRGDKSYDWTHKALNRLIQGGSADQTKKAMVEGDRAGYYIQLQVHDEIDGSFTDRKAAEGMAEIMSTTYELNVPFKVDIEMGPSWGEAK